MKTEKISLLSLMLFFSNIIKDNEEITAVKLNNSNTILFRCENLINSGYCYYSQSDCCITNISRDWGEKFEKFIKVIVENKNRENVK